MKTLPSGLAAHIAARDTTIATALKITRVDGTVYGFTSCDIDASISGVTYRANPGLDVSNVVIAANAAVGNMELTTLHDGTTFTTPDILSGRWRNAAFTIFRYNWANLSDGIDTLLVGTLGEAEIRQGTLVIELRDLRQYLQQSVGDASSKNCRARLGDARCGINLASYTVTGTITSVTDNQTFTDSSKLQASDWFAEGELTFTSGPNAGIRAKIKAFASGGVFTLALPIVGSAVAAGHTYSAIAGCRKRLSEDCHDKFSNVVNFVGEPHRPGVNKMTSAAGGSV